MTATSPSAALAPPFIPLCEPLLAGNEWPYVKECLDTGWVSSVGAFVDRFERSLAAVVARRHAVATVNGTAALHVALLASGVQADDEVLVSTVTFIAPANAVRYIGAWPVFIDAEPVYWQMDPVKAVEFLERRCVWKDGTLRNRDSGRRVRAVMPVHILGHPVDMTPLVETARKYGLVIIEDATESLGAQYHGRAVGSLGDIAAFSFNGNKLITTGGGGMVVTDDETLARRVRHLTTQAKDDPVEYVHGEIGYNYRLTNVLAALGVAQLEQLDLYLTRKRQIAARYHEAFRDILGLRSPVEAPWARSAWWMYAVLVDEPTFGMSARCLLRVLGEDRIQTRPLWEPMHRSRAHAGAQHTDCSVADTLVRDGLCLPCSVGLEPAHQERVIERIRTRAARER